MKSEVWRCLGSSCLRAVRGSRAPEGSLSSLKHKQVNVTPRFEPLTGVKTEFVLTSNDAILDSEQLSLVVAGDLGVRIGHSGQEGKALGDVCLRHLMKETQQIKSTVELTASSLYN